MAKVSVILTSYNQPQWLNQAIQSVRDQSHEDWELWIMDDNSSNLDVKKIIDRHHYEDSRVNCYISNVQPQDRMLTARYATLINLAAAETTGDYLTFLTDDDFYLPTRLADMLSVFESTENIHAVYGWQNMQYGDDEPYDVRQPQGILDDGYDVLDHNSVMVDRESFFAVGGWDDNPIYWRGADGIFWRRLSSIGVKFHPCNSITDTHRFHTESVRHKLLEQGLEDLN